jgi:glycosyltransferase involved in cell wall biosynthesis
LTPGAGLGTPLDMTTGPSTARDGLRRPLRLLQVTEDLGFGGLERVVATLCRSIDPQLVECGVVCLRDGGIFADQLRTEGFTVLQLEYRRGKPDYFNFLQLSRLVRSRRVDVLHTHNTNAFIAGGLVRLLNPSVRLVHTDHARPYPDKWRYIMAERALSRLASRVVGVSADTTEDLRRHVGVPPRRLQTINNGIVPEGAPPPSAVSRAREEMRLPAGVPVIGLGARLIEQKNIELLLDAFAILVRTDPLTHLVICGDGPLRAALESRAIELGVAERTRFPGFRSDMPAVMHLFDVYTLTSHWEGLPMAILEAMAAGIPIVATDVGGVSSAVMHGETGTLVPAGDAEGFAAACRALLSDRTVRESYAARSREVFAQRFSARAMAAQYERLYMGSAATVS